MRALVFIAAALAACGQSVEQGYLPAYELNFMRGCEAQGAPRAVCACSWARVEAEIPRAELDRLERLPAAARPNDPVQKQLESFALQCTVAEEAPPSAP